MNNNNINNNHKFLIIFRNKIIKNKIIFYLKLFNLYYQQRSIKIDEKILLDPNDSIIWSHPHREYFRSIRISCIYKYNIENVIRLISSLPQNIQVVQLKKPSGLSQHHYQLLLDSCKGLIKSISIPLKSHYDKISIPTSTERLKLKNNSTSLNSISTLSNLTSLDLHSAYSTVQLLLNDAPKTLKTLYLNGRFDSTITPGSLPSSLTKLKFGIGFNQIINNSSILPVNLQSIEFSINYTQPLDFQYFPSSIKKIKLLTIGKPVNKFKNEHLLLNLQLLYVSDYFTHSFKIPSHLLKLSIGIRDIKTLKSLYKLKKLKKLYLMNDSAKIFFGHLGNHNHLSALKYLPANLRSLKLKSNTELSFDELPTSITKLKIQYNNFNEAAIKEITLPPSVHTLKLNISQHISPSLLSKNTQLKRLEIAKRFDCETQRDSLPSSLQSLETSLISPIGELYLPSGLRYLKVENQLEHKSNINLISNLQVLEIGKGRPYTIYLDQLPKSLQILIIRGETNLKLNSSSSSLPPALESIYVDSLNHSILSNTSLSLQLIDQLKPISTLQLNKLYNKIIKNKIQHINN